MALSHDRVVLTGRAAYTLANEATTLLSKINYFLAHNSDISIDWAAAQKPAYINEDAAGNIDGLPFSRQQVSNAIHSLDQIRKVLENEDLAEAQGDHLGNLNQLANAMPTR